PILRRPGGGKRLAQRAERLLTLADRRKEVTHPDENSPLPLSVGDCSSKRQPLVVSGDGFLYVSKRLVDVANDAERIDDSLVIAESPIQEKRLLKRLQRPAIVP